jgi:hypothetical protein
VVHLQGASVRCCRRCRRRRHPTARRPALIARGAAPSTASCRGRARDVVFFSAFRSALSSLRSAPAVLGFALGLVVLALGLSSLRSACRPCARPAPSSSRRPPSSCPPCPPGARPSFFIRSAPVRGGSVQAARAGGAAERTEEAGAERRWSRRRSFSTPATARRRGGDRSMCGRWGGRCAGGGAPACRRWVACGPHIPEPWRNQHSHRQHLREHVVHDASLVDLRS